LLLGLEVHNVSSLCEIVVQLNVDPVAKNVFLVHSHDTNNDDDNCARSRKRGLIVMMMSLEEVQCENLFSHFYTGAQPNNNHLFTTSIPCFWGVGGTYNIIALVQFFFYSSRIWRERLSFLFDTVPMPFVPYQKHAPVDASLPLCTLLFGSEDGEEEIPAALNM